MPRALINILIFEHCFPYRQTVICTELDSVQIRQAVPPNRAPIGLSSTGKLRGHEYPPLPPTSSWASLKEETGSRAQVMCWGEPDYISASDTSSGSFPAREVTFHVPLVSINRIARSPPLAAAKHTLYPIPTAPPEGGGPTGGWSMSFLQAASSWVPWAKAQSPVCLGDPIRGKHKSPKQHTPWDHWNTQTPPTQWAGNSTMGLSTI